MGLSEHEDSRAGTAVYGLILYASVRLLVDGDIRLTGDGARQGYP